MIMIVSFLLLMDNILFVFSFAQYFININNCYIQIGTHTNL